MPNGIPFFKERIVVRRIVSCVFVAVICLSFGSCKAITSAEKFKKYSFDYFDTATTIIGYASSQEEFDNVCEDIFNELENYHKLYNIYYRYDGVNNILKINELTDGKHSKVTVDKKIIDLLLFSREMYEKTNGSVNIGMGSVLSIWHDYRTYGSENPSEAELPQMNELKEAGNHTDINDMIIDKENNTVYLKDDAMSLDVGAIAKGYAVEQVALYLENKGINGYLLNVGGNVRSVGKRPDGEKWTVGIENPDTENEDEPYIAYLGIESMAVVTSGSYQRYYIVDGKRYHHIIDPETLMPGENFQSVSILCPDSGKGDALSTALFSMSYEKGSQLIESLVDTEAMWVLPDGTIKYSSGFKKYTTTVE